MNDSKTISVNFTLRRKQQDHRPLEDCSNQLSFLGVVLDAGLTWENYAEELCKKLSKTIYWP